MEHHRPRSTRRKPANRKRAHRTLALALSSVVALSGFVITLAPEAEAQAVAVAQTQTTGPSALAAALLPMVAGQPGVPNDPIALLKETFEVGQTRHGNSLSENYVGVKGQAAKVAPFWAVEQECNGVILGFEISWRDALCNKGGKFVRKNVRRFADVLGQLDAGVIGGSTSATPVNQSTYETKGNHAVTAWTAETRSNRPNLTVYETSPMEFIVDGTRFISTSIDVAETACLRANGKNNSLLDFTVRTGGQDLPISDTPIRACTDTGVAYFTSDANGDPDSFYGPGSTYVSAGRYFSKGAVLLSEEQLSGISMTLTNQISESDGNDFAFDNIQLLDVTPGLHKSFSPTSVPVGGISTLTLTVTNTSELGAKVGWQFTDNLPEGLVIADPTNIGGTCNATKSATSGGTSVTVENGQFAAGDVSCTIVVDVTSETPRGSEPSPKIYENCAVNFSDVIGVELPNCAIVEFYSDPDLLIKKESTPASGTPLAEGEAVTYKLTFTNITGTSDAAVDHIDHLNDVLDDADFVSGSIRYGDGAGTDTATSPLDPGVTSSSLTTDKKLLITGTVPVGETRTVSFQVTVKPHSEQTTARGAGTAGTTGYLLQNFLTDKETPPPPVCVPAVDEDPNCTRHPVPAWTLEKSSLPEDGSAVQVDNNVYYRIDIKNLGRTGLTGISITDDMTDVLATTVWDPGAPELGLSPFTVSYRSAPGEFGSSFRIEQLTAVPEWNATTSTWNLTVPLNFYSGEILAQISYAVKAGYGVDMNTATPDPTVAGTTRANLGTTFTNVALGELASLPPIDCDISTAADPADICDVTHSIGEGFFHIQKNSADIPVGGPTALPVSFELFDATSPGGLPEAPSMKLCRDANGDPDWGSGSLTHKAIVDWNSSHPLEAPEELCGLFYSHASADEDGHAAGTWHVQNVPDGDYYLVEVAAPDEHQLLAQPVLFRVGGAAGSGRLSIPDPLNPSTDLPSCSSLWDLPVTGQPFCAMPSGLQLHVYDAKNIALPLVGGLGLLLTTGVGLGVLVFGIGIVLWWSRQRNKQTISTTSDASMKGNESL